MHALLGRVREKNGSPGQARQAYARALKIYPGYTYARRRLFRIALDEEDFPLARSQVELLLEQSDEPQHSFLAALLAAREGHTADARARYREAIDKAGGDYPEAYFNLGRLERAAGNLDAAIDAYRRAIELRPTYTTAMNNLGLTLKKADKLEEAEQVFKRAIEVDRKYASSWLNLGEVYAAYGRYQDSISAFEKAIAAKPGYKKARLNLGVAYRRTGQNALAIRTYRQLIEEHPRYVLAWHNLAMALEAEGRDDEAVESYRRCLELDSEHVPTLRNLAALEARLAESAAAKQMVTELLDRAPGDTETRLLLAELHRRSGDLNGCAEQARRILAESSASPKAAALLSQCSH